MPVKSKQQMKFIWALRNKYKSKSKAPKKWKWVFNKEWTDGVDYKSLPKKMERLKTFEEFTK
jgi:hypothetical protein